MGVIDVFRRKPSAELVREDPTLSLDAWAEMMNAFVYSGNTYTLPGSSQEEIGGHYTSTARGAYKANGVVFACMLVRSLLFSEARFMYRRTRGGRPGDLFDLRHGEGDLDILRVPWPNGTTGDLLSRMIQHVDLAGNAFVARRAGKLAVLRPDWVTIIGGVVGDADATVWHPDAEVLGYAFRDGGPGSGHAPIFFDVSEVAHFAPIPDPEARFRGMSWLTPLVREIMSDKAMNEHKLAFFENGATPNLLVKMDVDDLNKFKAIVSEFRSQHEGAQNAYKTLFLAAGADATAVGANLHEIDFKITQGAGETRIAAAAGVPPVIVGLSEGLDAATYSNYAQARRRLSDGTMRPLWRQAAGALATIVRVPSDAELWYDARDILFLQEDQKDAAEIQQVNAMSIRTLVDSGFKPDSVVAAITAGDLNLLEHTSLFSVQLQPAGTTPKQGLLQSVPVPDNKQPAPPAANGANGRDLDILAALLRGQRSERPLEIHAHMPEQQPAVVEFHEGAFNHTTTVEAGEPVRVEIAEGAFRSETTVQPAEVRVEPAQITVEAAPTPDVNVHVDAPPPAEVSVSVTPELRAEMVLASDAAELLRGDAPTVTVEVNPTPVTVENTVNVPETPVNVNVQPAEDGPKHIRFRRNKDGTIKDAEVTDG